MIVSKIRDATTEASPVQYELTVRVRSQELDGDPLKDLLPGGFADQLAHLVRKAIGGLQE